MIDLHIHTNYSDGSDSLIDVLKKAEKLNLKYISITDHENCRAYEELSNIDISQYYTGKIIPGVELKAGYNGKIIDILGYKINTYKMQQWLDEFYKDKSHEQIQQKYFDILYQRCKQIDLTIKEKDNIKFNPKKDWAKVVIFEEIRSYKENHDKLPQDMLQDFNTFSKKYCADKDNIFYIDRTKDYPTVQEVINVIKDCNGLVFLPHVYIYGWIENIDEYIKIFLDDYKIDGLECFHSYFNQEQIEHLLNTCKNKKVFISGGSDYHGENKVSIKLAYGKENLKIDEKYIKDWA